MSLLDIQDYFDSDPVPPVDVVLPVENEPIPHLEASAHNPFLDFEAFPTSSGFPFDPVAQSEENTVQNNDEVQRDNLEVEVNTLQEIIKDDVVPVQEHAPDPSLYDKRPPLDKTTRGRDPVSLYRIGDYSSNPNPSRVGDYSSNRSPSRVGDASNRSPSRVGDSSNRSPSRAGSSSYLIKQRLIRSPSPLRKDRPLDVSTENPLRWMMKGFSITDTDEISHSITCSQLLKLREELNSTKRRLYHLTEAHAGIVRRKQELQRELVAAYGQISELEAASSIRVGEQGELKTDLKLAKRRIAETEREAANAIDRASKFERELVEMERKRQKYVEDLNGADMKLAELERKIRNIEDEVKELTTENKKLSYNVAARNTEIEELRRENKELKEETISKMTDYKNLSRTLEKLAKAKPKQNGSIDVKSNDGVSSLRAEIQVLQSKYENAEKKLDNFKLQIRDQKGKLEQAILWKEKAEEELRRSRESLEKHKSDKRSLLDKLDVCKRKLLEEEKEKERAKREGERLHQENRDLKQKISELKSQKKISETQMSRDARKEETLSRSYEDLKEQIIIMKEQNMQLLNEIDTSRKSPAKTKQEENEQKSNSVKDELKLLAEKLDELRTEQHNMSDQIDTIRTSSHHGYPGLSGLLIPDRRDSLQSVHTEIPSLIVPDRSGRNSPVNLGRIDIESPPAKKSSPRLSRENPFYGSNRDISFTTHLPAVNRDSMKKTVNLDLSADSNESVMTTDL